MHTYVGWADTSQLWLFQSDDTVNQKGFEKTDMLLSNTTSLWGMSLKAVHGGFSDICCSCSLESFSLTFICNLEMSFRTDVKQWWNFQLWCKELKFYIILNSLMTLSFTKLWIVSSNTSIDHINMFHSSMVVLVILKAKLNRLHWSTFYNIILVFLLQCH